MKIVLGLLLIFCSFFAVGRELLVCSPNCDAGSIQAAIDLAEEGDTITVSGGFYQEGTIVINKPLLVRGKDSPVIDGQGKFEIVQIISDNVRFTGFTLQNTGLSFMKDLAAIKVINSRYVTIDNNTVLNTLFGIYFEKSKNSKIYNNYLKGEAVEEATSGNAIHLWYCDSMTIEKNKSLNFRDGIYLEFVKNSTIKGNYSKQNLRYGLHFMFSDYNRYLHNTFENNGAGVAVMYSKKILMNGNKFLQNWGTASYGLLLKEIYDSEIINNEFNQNTIGIFAEGVTRCTIKNNNFSRNGWALKIMGSSLDNIVTLNNFISNTFDISTTAKFNNNTYSENFWSAYSGYDLDRDGFGDVPYRPVRLFSYMVGEIDSSVLLLRSFFIDLLDYAEKIMPSLTPADLIDPKPLMNRL